MDACCRSRATAPASVGSSITPTMSICPDFIISALVTLGGNLMTAGKGSGLVTRFSKFEIGDPCQGER